MSVDPRFDDMLFGILSNVGSIEKFLDIIFSFLYRRTDFFAIRTGSSEKLGLPPGVAEKILKVVSGRYVQMGKARMDTTNSESGSAPEEKAEKGAETKSSLKKKKTNNSGACSSADPTSKDHIAKEDDNCKKQHDSHRDKEKEVKIASEAPAKSETTSSVTTEEKQMDSSKEEEERKYYTSNPESYNGASYDNYSWAQNNFELDIQVKVPNDIKRGDQVKIFVDKTLLKVEALQDEKWKTLLDGTLMYEIKPGSSTWTLHPHDHVHVNVEKGYPRYWEALLEGEPKLNVRTIDCSIPFEDVDEEAQAKLQQMMFDQHQKRLGKPTSEELKVQEMLKKSWDKQDSPFRGQKFDPSVLRLGQ